MSSGQAATKPVSDAVGAPTVSVIMPVYNGQKHVHQAVSSVLDQSFRAIELIVINDGSTDATGAILQEFKDPRLVYIKNPVNLGITRTRNIGLKKARGRYIAMLDCDDLAFSQRLEIQSAYLDRNPEMVMVASWAEFEKRDERGRLVRDVWRTRLKTDRIPAILLFGNYFIQSTVMLRAIALPEEGYRGEGLAEDYDLWVRMTAIGKVHLICKPLVRYRVHDGGVSQRKEQNLESACRAVVASQLKNLGVEAGSYELDLHREIALGQMGFCAEQLPDVERWLLGLGQANGDSRFHDANAFNGVIANFWLFTCLRSRQNWFARIRTYYSSVLVSGYRIRHLLRLIVLAWDRLQARFGRTIVRETESNPAGSN